MASVHLYMKKSCQRFLPVIMLAEAQCTRDIQYVQNICVMLSLGYNIKFLLSHEIHVTGVLPCFS